MTISTFTRLTGLLLVAGFFYSCGSSQVNIDELLANKNYQQAIAEIETRLNEDPEQPSLYIQHAEINAALAQSTDPELRAPFYQNITDDFASAVDYGATSGQTATIDSLRQQYWKLEHNAGLRMAENKDVVDPYQLAKIHFENALIIRDDAVSSYQNLSVAEFNLGNLDAAIQSMLNAIEYSDKPTADMYENLGYLYLEQGDPSQAAHYYEMANTDMKEDLNLAFGLINAYIANGNHEDASDMLETLVSANPENANLRNVYGTQLYAITSDIMSDLKQAYVTNDTVLVNQIRFEAEGMGDEAETQLIEAFRRDTANTKYLESLAVFYNNLSAQYLSLVKVAFDSDQAALQKKASTLIRFAIDYYKKLVAVDPNNEEYLAKLDVLEQLK